MLEIVNLKDGDVVPHCVCLVRVCGAEIDSCRGTIYNETEDNGNVITCHVNQGEFNSFVLLIEGHNELRIACGNEEIVLNIIFKPLTNQRFVRLVYVTLLNEDKFQGPFDMNCSPSEAIKRIQTGAMVLQTFMAESLASEGLERKTFNLEMDLDDRPKVHTIQIPLTIREACKFTEEKLWEAVALRILSSPISDKNCKYLAFFCGTRYSNPSQKLVRHEREIVSMTRGHISLGGGGLALVGTGALYTWATDVLDVMNSFLNDDPTDTKTLMDFSAGRGTWGASYGTHLGSVLHELAHTFDLGHTPHGIMARGFEDLHLFFTSTKLKCDYLSQSPHHHKSMMSKSMSSSLIKDSVTFTTDFVRKIPTDNINITVEPAKEPIASSIVYSPSVTTRRCLHSEEQNEQQLEDDDLITSPRFARRNCERVVDSCSYSSSPSSKTSNYFANSHKPNIYSGTKCRAFWARSSAILLAYHKWMNETKSGGKPELKGSVICSTAGIRVVELRDLHTMCFHHWEYIIKPPPPVLHLPWAQVSHWPSDHQIEVVAEDSNGNLLKGCFIPRPL